MPRAPPATIVSSGVTLSECGGRTNIPSGRLCMHAPLRAFVVTVMILKQPGGGYQERPEKGLESAFSLMKITTNAAALLPRVPQQA